MKKKYRRYVPIIYRKYNLFDHVRVKDTGETGYIVDISRKGNMVIEKDNDDYDDRLIYDVKQKEIEKIDD